MNDDHGAAGLMLLFVSTLALMALGVVGAITIVATARAQASTAADLAALAGARQGGCEAAASVAGANGALIRDCVRQGRDIVLATDVTVRVLGRTLTITSQARAGPA